MLCRGITLRRICDCSALLTDFLGTSEFFGNFTSIGELRLSMAHGEGETRSYRRSLDLSTSLGRVEYEVDGVRHERELFCSYPDRVLVVTLAASEMERRRAGPSRPG